MRAWTVLATTLSICFAGAASCTGSDPDLTAGVDARTGDSVAAPSDGAPPPLDGPAAPPTCLRANFAPAIHLLELSTAERELSVSLSSDERNVYVSHDDAEGGLGAEVFTSTRALRTDPFPPLVRFLPTSSGADDFGAVVLPNNIELVFASSRSGVPTSLYRVRRGSSSQSWPEDAAVPLSLAIDAAATLPFATSDELWFSSGTPGEFALFRAGHDPDGGYAVPAVVDELRTLGASALGVALDASGLVVFFGSTRAGGAGGADVWTASRRSIVAPFEDVHVVDAPGVNTAADDRPTWLSPDGCRLYIVSNREGSIASTHDLWMAERTPR